jgi:hypothetical protein
MQSHAAAHLANDDSAAWHARARCNHTAGRRAPHNDPVAATVKTAITLFDDHAPAAIKTITLIITIALLNDHAAAATVAAHVDTNSRRLRQYNRRGVGAGR